MLKKSLFFLAAIILVLATGCSLSNKNQNQSVSINSFEECAAAGYPVLKIFPESCVAPDGRTFENEKQRDEINNQKTVVENPASVFCVEHEGKTEIRISADGSQYVACIFSDKSECDEWAFLRGECKPGEGSLPQKNYCVNKCGDGVCQEVVCGAIGCPCPETKESCSQDCN